MFWLLRITLHALRRLVRARTPQLPAPTPQTREFASTGREVYRLS